MSGLEKAAKRWVRKYGTGTSKEAVFEAGARWLCYKLEERADQSPAGPNEDSWLHIELRDIWEWMEE